MSPAEHPVVVDTPERIRVLSAGLEDRVELTKLYDRVSTIKNRLFGSGRIPDEEHRTLSQEWDRVKRKMSEIQGRLTMIKNERRILAAKEEAVRQDRIQQLDEAKDVSSARLSAVLKRLIDLRDDYLAQSRDGTRTDAVRFMSNAIQEKLSKVISSS